MDGLIRENEILLRQASNKVKLKYKNRRQALRQLRKNKNKKSKDKCYIAGAFNNNLIPDIDFINHAPEVLVTSVDDNVSQIIYCAQPYIDEYGFVYM